MEMKREAEEREEEASIIDKWLGSFENRDLLSRKRDKRTKILKNAAETLTALKEGKLTICGDDLRETQKMAAVGFYTWLKYNRDDEKLTGHLVAPMGSGKTRTAVLLSDMTGGRILYFCYSNPLGEETVTTFRRHEMTKPPKKRRTVGQCFGGKAEFNRDIVIVHFSSLEKLIDQFDFDDINLVFVDEADVNGLSSNRAAFVTALAETYGVPTIGMSATEEQASGKRLKDVFEHEILKLSIPQALPQMLELGLVPNMKFQDLALDPSLTISAEDVMRTEEIDPAIIREFIRSTNWNALLIDHYRRNFMQPDSKGRPAVVIFRDNELVVDFVRQAQKAGISAAAFTGDLTPVKLAQIKEAFQRGEVHMLVGSKLLGRGTDIPEIEVVYNSTLTRSPQIFWQADGRGMRVNPHDPAKTVFLISVLPRRMIDQKTGRALLPQERPLCHAAFFDLDYFDRKDIEDPQKLIEVKDLADITDIRSTEEVDVIFDEYRTKPQDFVGKPEWWARFISALKEIKVDARIVTFLQHTHSAKLRAIIENLAAGDGGVQIEDVSEPAIGFDISKLVFPITLKEEKQLITDYHTWQHSDDPTLKRASEEACEKLIAAHMPVIVSLAKNLASKPDEVDDLIQVGLGSFFRGLNTFIEIKGVRLITYTIRGIWWSMQREAQELLWREHEVIGDLACNIPEPEITLHEAELREKLRNFLTSLLPREEEVLVERFGLNASRYDDTRTLGEIGMKFGIGVERIRQIEARALRKLCRPSRSKSLKPYFDEGENREMTNKLRKLGVLPGMIHMEGRHIPFIRNALSFFLLEDGEAKEVFAIEGKDFDRNWIQGIETPKISRVLPFDPNDPITAISRVSLNGPIEIVHNLVVDSYNSSDGTVRPLNCPFSLQDFVACLKPHVSGDAAALFSEAKTARGATRWIYQLRSYEDQFTFASRALAQKLALLKSIFMQYTAKYYYHELRSFAREMLFVDS